METFMIGSAAAYMAVFATLLRNAWYEAYYNEDGTPNGL